ncbi:MAG: galA [Phycisphaerales bacterium]|nr:galA [Phycisphaerales bacterium]
MRRKASTSAKAAHGYRAHTPAPSRPKRRGGSRVEGLESRTLLSTSWFVSPSGSTGNPGTLSAPFKTIQQAADVAQAGDKVEIRAGIYHETVSPANSGTASAPIVFESYNGENVTVSGADPVYGWSNAGGSIYTSSMPWDLGDGNNQVFVDGKMINEARFPNTGLDISHPTLGKAAKATVSGSVATLYDPALSQAANYWKGATIHIAPGQAWIAQTGTVLSSAPGQVTFSFKPNDKYELPAAGNAYYLTGIYNALGGAAEWYRDASGKLYAWMPAGDNPAGHDVEVKRRLYAFDVSDQQNITIQNLNIFAATVNSNSGSTGEIINHVNVRYVGQFLLNANGWSAPTNSGIVLRAANSIVENCTIAFGAGDGILVQGNGSRVTNNVIHDIDYSASDAAAVRIYASHVEVDHNTIYNTGRSGITHAGSGLKILYNTLHDLGLQTTEAGGIYSVETNGGGTEIAYNQISNMHSGGFGQTALFLDNNSNNYVVHHNIVSNVDYAMKLNFNARYNNIYNNTLDASIYSVFTNLQGDWTGTKLTNNVFLKTAVFNRGSTQSNNVYSASSGGGQGAGNFTSGASDNIVSVANTPPATTPPTGPDGKPVTTPPAPGPQPPPVPPDPGTTPVGAPPTTPPPPTDVPVIPAPPPPTTVADFTALVAADKAALIAARVLRTQTLRALSASLRAHAAAYRTALHQLRAAVSAAKHSRTPAVGVSDLTASAQQYQQALQSDQQTLAADRKTDFTGILTVRQKLAADQKALRLARRKSK